MTWNNDSYSIMETTRHLRAIRRKRKEKREKEEMEKEDGT